MDIRGIFVFDSVILQQADQLGQYCRDAGIRYIVFSFLDYGTIDDIYSKIETVRHTAGILGQYGVRVLQHNHEHDTALITDRDGKKKPIIDVFLEQLSPEELMLEVDTGWIKYAGLDPAEYIREKAERIMILHLKDICHDFREVSRDKIFVPCGAGAVDFQAVMDAIPADRRDSMLYVIDQDASGGDIVDDLITGMQYLNGLHM